MRLCIDVFHPENKLDRRLEEDSVEQAADVPRWWFFTSSANRLHGAVAYATEGAGHDTTLILRFDGQFGTSKRANNVIFRCNRRRQGCTSRRAGDDTPQDDKSEVVQVT